MAKKSLSYSFKNAYVDRKEGTITEVTKEEELTFNLWKILDEFDGKQVSFSIKEELSPTPIEYDNESDDE